MKSKLKQLLNNSYAPYSNMHFACIVECSDGKMYSGVNVENASFGGTICAERNAINSAISDGNKNFKVLYLMNDTENFLYPCKICEQTFLEFFKDDVIFNIMNKDGKCKIFTFNEIKKTIFSKDDVK